MEKLKLLVSLGSSPRSILFGPNSVSGLHIYCDGNIFASPPSSPVYTLACIICTVFYKYVITSLITSYIVWADMLQKGNNLLYFFLLFLLKPDILKLNSIYTAYLLDFICYLFYGDVKILFPVCIQGKMAGP